MLGLFCRASDEPPRFVDASPSPLPVRMTHVFELRIFLRQEYSRYALPEVPGVIKLCRDLQFPSLIYVAPLLAITFFVEKNCNWSKATKFPAVSNWGLMAHFPSLSR